MTETEGEHQILDRKEQHAHYYPQKEPGRQIYPATQVETTEDYQLKTVKAALPNSAKVIKSLGNDWYYISIEGKFYLYSHYNKCLTLQ